MLERWRSHRISQATRPWVFPRRTTYHPSGQIVISTVLSSLLLLPLKLLLVVVFISQRLYAISQLRAHLLLSPQTLLPCFS